MNNIILYIVISIALLLQCSCSLSRNVSWGEYIAETKPMPLGFAWGTNKLEKMNDNFVITIGVTNQYFSEKNNFMENYQNITIKTGMIFDSDLNIDAESHSCILKFKTGSEKTLWTKHFDSIVFAPDYIYDNKGDLLFLVTLSEGKNSEPGRVLLLDPQNGNIQTTFTLDKIPDVRAPWGICMSNDFQFLIIKQPIQWKPFEPYELIYLIFKRDQKNISHFKYIGVLSFPKECAEGFSHDKIRINNNVAIISMAKGRRTSFMPSQKIIFFNLENTSIMFEYSLSSCEWICDAAITADHKYVALFFTNHTIRLYRTKQQ